MGVLTLFMRARHTWSLLSTSCKWSLNQTLTETPSTCDFCPVGKNYYQVWGAPIAFSQKDTQGNQTVTVATMQPLRLIGEKTLDHPIRLVGSRDPYNDLF